MGIKEKSVLIIHNGDNWNNIKPTTGDERLYIITNLALLIANRSSEMARKIMQYHSLNRSRVVAITSCYDETVVNLCSERLLFGLPLTVYRQVIDFVCFFLVFVLGLFLL